MLLAPRKKRNRIILFLIFIGLHSCRSGVVNSRLPLHDSGNFKPDSLKQEMPTLSEQYIEFLGKFKKNKMGYLDSATQIQISLVDTLLSEKVNTRFYTSIEPIEWIKNKYGNFFIIRLNCNAGGSCTTYEILFFDKEGKFIKKDDLGMFAADGEEIDRFRYDKLSDTALLLYKMEYDNLAEKTIDSTTQVISLTPYLPIR